jgi:hypothetical protein
VVLAAGCWVRVGLRMATAANRRSAPMNRPKERESHA